MVVEGEPHTKSIAQEFIEQLHQFITDKDYGCMDIFQKLFEKGKDYEFLCRTLKIALSHLNSTYKSEPMRIATFKEDGGELFKKSLAYVENLATSNDFKTILSRMPEAYLIVLISGKNGYHNCRQDYFTFTLAYKEYKCFLARNNTNLYISKETFIKIFIDLIQKGFFKSKATSDLISVNNKVVLGIEENDLQNMIKEHIKYKNEYSTNLSLFAENRA
jgi:hypothetical protein